MPAHKMDIERHKLRSAELGYPLLAKYLNATWGSSKRLAIDLEVSDSHLARLKLGKIAIDIRMAIMVEVATNGELKAEDLLPDGIDNRLLDDWLSRRIGKLLRS